MKTHPFIAPLAAVLALSPACKKDQTHLSAAPQVQQTITEPAKKPDSYTKLRRTILSYLSQPRFSSADFLTQISGTQATFRMYDLDADQVYLSIPARSYTEKGTLPQLTTHPEHVQFGTTADGKFAGARIQLGDFYFNKPGNYFFRFPADDFRVDPKNRITVKFPRVTYTITMDELMQFVDNSSIYGGLLTADKGTDRNGDHHTFENHGAFVAKKGEKSLERLVHHLTPRGASPETTTQVLLDFVTNDLRYDFEEANDSVEILKRPNEVFMSRGSDCSGKVIAYASLLEQTGADYRIVYLDHHITVAVAGNFSPENGMNFNLGRKTYFIAETTAKGFVIGKSLLDSPLTFDQFRYLQRPAEDAPITDFHTGRVLPFL